MSEPMIYKKGSGKYEVRVSAPRDPVTGRRRQLVRTVNGTLADARRVRDKLKVEAWDGRSPQTAETVGALLEAWLDHAWATWSPSTQREHRRIVDRVLLPKIGSLPLSKLTVQRIDAFYGELRDRGGATGTPLSAASVRRVHVVLRSALAQGVRWGWLGHNPAVDASPPPVGKAELNVPTREVLTQLVRYLEEHDPDFYLFVRLSAHLGTRRGETVALRWSDVQGDVVVVASSMVIGPDGVVDRRRTKTGNIRRIRISPGVVALLGEHRRRLEQRCQTLLVLLPEDAYLFAADPEGTEAWRPDSVSRRFSRLAARAGVTGVRLHDLRHYVATTLIAEGVDVRTVAHRLGHASPSTTLNVYAHYVAEADSEAARILD